MHQFKVGDRARRTVDHPGNMELVKGFEFTVHYVRKENGFVADHNSDLHNPENLEFVAPQLTATAEDSPTWDGELYSAVDNAQAIADYLTSENAHTFAAQVLAMAAAINKDTHHIADLVRKLGAAEEAAGRIVDLERRIKEAETKLREARKVRCTVITEPLKQSDIIGKSFGAFTCAGCNSLNAMIMEDA